MPEETVVNAIAADLKNTPSYQKTMFIFYKESKAIAAESAAVGDKVRDMRKLMDKGFLRAERNLALHKGGVKFDPKQGRYVQPKIGAQSPSLVRYRTQQVPIVRPKLKYAPQVYSQPNFMYRSGRNAFLKVVPRRMASLYRLGRVATLASRANLITAVVGALFQVAVEKTIQRQVLEMVRLQKQTYKKVCRIGLQQLNNHIQGTLRNAANSIDLNVSVDTSNYDRAIQQYMRNTRKSAIEVVNQKAYWIGLNAIRETYKANKTTIKNDLEKPADKMRGLTVAEAIIVDRRYKNHEKPLTRGELRKEARALINKRIRAIGFLKSGWIPAVKRLAPLVNKKVSVGMHNVKKGKDKGGAKPAVESMFTNVVVASIWNDIQADNNPRAQAYMRQGLQRGLDMEAKSMLAYVESKMRKNAEKFNRA